MSDPSSIDSTLRAASPFRCRGCLERWHGIPKGRELTADEQAYVVDVICRWIETDLTASGRRAPR
ncbi:MAG: hypothetical protein V7607_444 [Solirubrobacteraceae bacterium]